MSWSLYLILMSFLDSILVAVGAFLLIWREQLLESKRFRRIYCSACFLMIGLSVAGIVASPK